MRFVFPAAAVQLLHDGQKRALNEVELVYLPYLVGLLLIYKRFTPDTLTKRVMIKIIGD